MIKIIACVVIGMWLDRLFWRIVGVYKLRKYYKNLGK